MNHRAITLFTSAIFRFKISVRDDLWLVCDHGLLQAFHTRMKGLVLFIDPHTLVAMAQFCSLPIRDSLSSHS